MKARNLKALRCIRAWLRITKTGAQRPKARNLKAQEGQDWGAIAEECSTPEGEKSESTINQTIIELREALVLNARRREI